MSNIPVTPTANLRSNILHDWANYTYNLQLWALTIDGFNKLASLGPDNDPEDMLKGAELLISNAGANKDIEPRSPSFPVDFIIDNLVVESIIGNRSQGKGADAINITFDIIEPYTVTLLNRLTQVVLRNGMGKDFKTLIYCMKIQFFGYDKFGKPHKIDGATKYIPMSLVTMQFSITNKGAVYQCKAVPKKNIALSVLDNTIPFHMEIEGTTVADLFNGAIVESNSNDAGARQEAAAYSPSTYKPTFTKGIGTALNDFEKKKVSNGKQKIANEYYFKFDNELLNASILDPKKLNVDAITYTSIKGTDGKNSVQSGRVGALEVNKESNKFNVAPGTKVTELINSVLKVTDYMKNQVKPAPDSNMPVRMWKIFPRFKITGYDERTNFFSRAVTFVVKTFDYYGEPHPNLGQKPPPESCIVKKYDYIYTGLNKDVIRANIDYKIAFFEVFTALPEEMTTQSNQGTGEDTSNKTDALPDKTSDSSFATPINLMTQNAPQQNTGASTKDVKAIAIGEFMERLLDNKGDLISLDLEIVGDPDWIQQDNIVYDVSTMQPGQKTLRNGTITHFDSMTCFQFNFKSPVKDYDDTTGMFDVSSSETSALFSGIYQVIKVENNFRKGKFTQKLTNNRIRIQNDKQVKVSNTAGTTTDAQPNITAGPRTATGQGQTTIINNTQTTDL
jgi:hypothetical protein